MLGPIPADVEAPDSRLIAWVARDQIPFTRSLEPDSHIDPFGKCQPTERPARDARGACGSAPAAPRSIAITDWKYWIGTSSMVTAAPTSWGITPRSRIAATHDRVEAEEYGAVLAPRERAGPWADVDREG